MTRVIERKSLLYRSKVEYGGWTINHVEGCSHGCTYCYATNVAKRTGRVASGESGREEWMNAAVVGNVDKLLDSELPRLSAKIDSVHLSFMCDPFMWDKEARRPDSAVCRSTMNIIRRLNRENIPVSVLTKGVYPQELSEELPQLHADNRYGITLVSLSESFRQKWEPNTAPVDARADGLAQLYNAGAKTWLSVEPYPTPNLDPFAVDVVPLLERVSFVDRIVFGKMNYVSESTKYAKAHPDFFENVANDVVEWCKLGGKVLHIKEGTPLAEHNQCDVLSVS